VKIKADMSSKPSQANEQLHSFNTPFTGLKFKTDQTKIMSETDT